MPCWPMSTNTWWFTTSSCIHEATMAQNHLRKQFCHSGWVVVVTMAAAWPM